MNDKNTITEFHSKLVLKQALIGYNKEDVLESYKKLDTLYDALIQNAKADSAERVKTLTEKVQNLETRVDELEKQKKKLSEENDSLTSELASQKQSDGERRTYYAKADMLSTAMLQFEREKAEQEKQIEFKRQSIIAQANAEAKELSVKFQSEYSDKVSSATAEIKSLKGLKTAIIEQMQKLEEQIAQQVKSFAVDCTEVK